MTLGVASHVYLPKNPGNLENFVRGMSQITTTDSGLDFTARKRSYGKVMFLHLSVILVTGGLCRRLGRGVSVQEGLCRKGWDCPGGLCSGGSVQGDPRTVEERALRILLECILVYRKIHNPDLFANILDFLIF